MRAVLAVVVGAPVEVVDLEREVAVARRQRVEHLEAGGDDLGADAVGRDGGDRVFAHGGFPDVGEDVSRAAVGGNTARQQDVKPTKLLAQAICRTRPTLHIRPIGNQK